MKFLFIIDPITQLSAYKDSSVAMMRALINKNHDIYVSLMSDLFINEGTVLTDCFQIDIPKGVDLKSKDWWHQKGENLCLVLSEFDGVLMRKDPPFDMEYLYATHLLELAERQGASVFNTGAAIRNHPEKLAITEFNQFTAPTLVTSSLEKLQNFYTKYEDIVVKPLDGMGGAGIFRVKPNDANFTVMIEMLTENGKQTIMAQKYIPSITEGDKRILIINGKPIPYCLARIPKKGEHRGNLAAGGAGVAQPLTDENKQIAEVVGTQLKGRGLFLIGLDVIGNNITEINVTSPTCFVEITEQTDFDVAEYFVDELIKVINSKK